MNNYRLAVDGDNLERICWPLFLQNQFPGYETFWQRYVVPLSNRPHNIYLKTDEELDRIGKTHHDVCIAQLHYTVLKHLHRTFVVLSSGDAMTEAELTEGIVRLSSALDVADELLERFTNPASYEPWKETGKRSGKTAREEWRNKRRRKRGKKIEPVEGLRYYRNHLVHGRIMPSINGLYPEIGRESNYFDWRKVTDPRNLASLDLSHFRGPREILASAWDSTLTYLRDMWDQHLLGPKGP